MSNDRQQVKQILGEARKIALVPAIVWLAYIAVALIFEAAAERRGLVTPVDIDLGLLLLGAAVLSLRMVAIFVLPAVVIYKLSARLLSPRASRRPGPS